MRKNTKRITALLLVLVMAVTMSTGTALADEPAPLDVDVMEEVLQDEDPLEEIDLQEEAGQEDIQEESTDGVDQIQAASLSLRGSGTAADPYQIYTEAELRLLEGDDTEMMKSHFILMNDIRLSGTENNWEPIGKHDPEPEKKLSFKGVFDGNDHTISNIQINREVSYPGLFGYVFNAEIRNLSTADSLIIGNGSAGIASNIYNTAIINCHSSADVYATYMNGSGGIVGRADDSYITDCTFSGSMDTTGPILSRAEMGGVAGYVQDTTIANCTNYGEIQNNRSGSIASTTSGSAGGIVGNISVGALIENCYNYGQISSSQGASTGGIAGKASSWQDYDTIIYNCINTKEIIGSGCTGGILGQAGTWNVHLQQNANMGKVRGPAETGGIVGFVYDGIDIKNCINHSDVAGSGGIVGYIRSGYFENNIINCLNTGSISAKSTAIGGISGKPPSKDTTVITRCVNTSEIIDPPIIGSAYRISGGAAILRNNYGYEGTLIGDEVVSGSHDDRDGADAAMAQLTSQRFYESLGWDFTDVWTMSGTSPYPVLQNAARNDQDLIALMDYGLTYRQALALSTPKRKLILNEIRVNHLNREQIVHLAEGLLAGFDAIEPMHEKVGQAFSKAQQSNEPAVPFRYEGLTSEEVGQIESTAETDSIQPYIFPLPPRNSVNSSDDTGTYFKVVADAHYTAATAHATLPRISNYEGKDRPYMMTTVNNLTNTLKVSVLGDYCVVYMDGAWYPHYTLGVWDPEKVNKDGKKGDYHVENIKQYDTPIEADELFFNVEIAKDGELSAVEYRLFDGQYNLLYSMKAQFPADELKPDGSNAKIERIISMAQWYNRDAGETLDTNTGTTMLNAKFNRAALYRFGSFRDWGIYETNDVLRQAPSEQQLSTVVINSYNQWDAEDITISFTIPNP